MALHDDLLEQAGHLVRRERLRPKQASLRRAVSAAYYALFHLLVADGAFRIFKATQPGLRALAGRAFTHGHMLVVCKQFASGGISPATKGLLTLPLPAQLITVAIAFVELQEARHDADYNLSKSWTRVEAKRKVQSAEHAFLAWRNIAGTPNAHVFAAAMLLQKHWTR